MSGLPQEGGGRGRRGGGEGVCIIMWEGGIVAEERAGEEGGRKGGREVGWLVGWLGGCGMECWL